MTSGQPAQPRSSAGRPLPAHPGGGAPLVTRLALAAIGGLPNLGLSLTLFVLWIAPSALADGGWVRVGATMVLLEFLLLHSGAFMAAGPMVCSKTWQRLAWFAGFLAAYAGAFIGFAYWTRNPAIVWVLAAVLLTRLAVLVVGPDKKATILMLQRSAFGTVLLLLTATLCFLPLPDLGLTAEVREMAFGTSADDVLTRHPERFVAWGAVYYLLMGAAELFVGWRLSDWSGEEVEKTWRALRSK